MYKRQVYAYAEQLAADGQKEAAATEFYSLGTYQDAADRGNALEYELAVSERAGDVHSALDLSLIHIWLLLRYSKSIPHVRVSVKPFSVYFSAFVRFFCSSRRAIGLSKP